MFSPLKVAKDYTALGRNASTKIILLFWISIGLAKSLFGFFHKMVQKNSNELFGQPNIFQKVISRKTIWSKLAVQVSSVTQSRLTRWDPMNCSTPGTLSITKSWSLLKLISIELGMPTNPLILCCSLLLPPSIFPSIRVFSNESVLHIRWPKYWSFSFSISPSKEHSGLISFRMDWLDLLAVQGTLKSLLQHHSSKASVLQHSAFCIVQLSYPYMTTGKTIALTRWTFVDKVMFAF